METIKKYFYLLKIHHWVKNLTIFLPILVGHSYLKSNLKEYFIYFLLLSILSSIIYLFNNLNDYEEDIKNKKLKYSLNLDKKKIYYTLGLISFFILISFTYKINQSIFFICLFYFCLSLSYNFYFKNKKYIDILILGLFHLLRIVYGSIAFNVDLSLYFILFCSAVFLMIGANKRLIEIDNLYKNRPYKKKDQRIIKIMEIFFSFFAILVFFLYSLDDNKNQFFVYEKLIYFNLILIVLIIINFLFLQKKKNQDIVMFIYKNKTNIVLVLIFFIIFIGNSVSFYN